MTVAEIIRQKLESTFQPLTLEIEDQSNKHQGHAGHRPGVETHFRVSIVSSAFDGVMRVQRHRMVMNVLKEEIGNPVHALALETLTPLESAKANKSV